MFPSSANANLSPANPFFPWEVQVSTATLSARQVIEDYFKALSGHAKAEQSIDLFVDDPHLKQHILETEASFPSYEVIPLQIVAEGDLVAVNATFKGTHKGTFAGIEPAGKTISIGVMIFYRVSNGRIAQFWMQADMQSGIDQLKN
jgi:predicted ester cyclase